jgi:ethanolamine utilization protein EutS
MEFEDKQRIIQEFVPGKQVTLAHLIASPDDILYRKLGVTTETRGALGVLTITPAEAAIIAADAAMKAASIELVFIDRFSGSLVICGDISSVTAALQDVLDVLCNRMGFTSVEISKT